MVITTFDTDATHVSSNIGHACIEDVYTKKLNCTAADAMDELDPSDFTITVLEPCDGTP